MIKLSKIKPNKDNPRVIKDDDFLALVDSIKKFPEMMKLKPIVVDEHWIVQAGNQRLKALLHLNYKDVPDDWILQSKDLTKDQWDEFVIKDNLHSGDWNFEMLKLNYNVQLLSDWGIETSRITDVNLDNFFSENKTNQTETKNKIILEYTDDDYAKVIEAFKKHNGSKEEIVYKLLEA